MIAHKYGYLETGNTLQINDSGIVYTDDPIAIVMFTNGIKRPYTCLSNYATLMAEYTQYHTAIRIEKEEQMAAEEAARLAEENAIAMLDQLTAERGENAGKLSISQILSDAEMRGSLVMCVVILGITVLALLVVMVAAIRKKIRFLPGVVTVVCFGAAMLVCVLGPKLGTVITAPAGDPQKTVTAFFDAVMAGDYEEAYKHLDYYSSLGLENEPADEASKLIYDQLRGTYSYRLHGDCLEEGLTAKQQVLMEHLDVVRLQSKLGDKTHDVLEEMVRTAPASTIYNADDTFKPEVTQKAYTQAVGELLEKPEYYRTTSGMELTLVYTNDGWKIQADEDLLRALCGGAY